MPVNSIWKVMKFQYVTATEYRQMCTLQIEAWHFICILHKKVAYNVVSDERSMVLIRSIRACYLTTVFMLTV